MQTEHQEFIGFIGIQQLPNQPENSGNPRQLLECWWPNRNDRSDYVQVRRPTAQSCENSDEMGLILPGSFNPLHRGHLAMAEIASQLTGVQCHFELSIANVDKPDLSLEEVIVRSEQSFGQHGLVVSTAAKFTEKATLYPNVMFAVGADTIVRLSDDRYHNNSQQQLAQAIDQFELSGCRFVVFGRMLSNKFVDSENISMNERLKELCEFVDRGSFEINLSSSDLRRGGSG